MTDSYSLLQLLNKDLSDEIKIYLFSFLESSYIYLFSLIYGISSLWILKPSFSNRLSSTWLKMWKLINLNLKLLFIYYMIFKNEHKCNFLILVQIWIASRFILRSSFIRLSRCKDVLSKIVLQFILIHLIKYKRATIYKNHFI